MIEHADLVERIAKNRDYQSVILAAFSGSRSVFEPGCQFGWNLAKLPENIVRVGLEVHEPYLKDPRCVRNTGIQYICANALEHLKNIKDGAFDGVMIMDFAEHFLEEQGVWVIEQCKRIAARRLLIWAPVGSHPQDYDEWGLGGEHWQTHRWEMHPKDLEKLGLTAIEWKGHHGPKNAKGQARCPDAMWGVLTK